MSRPARLNLLTARDRMVGLVALEWPEAGWDPAHDVRQHAALDLRAVHRSACLPGNLGDGADVIEVAVGDEDRLDLHPERVRRGKQAVGLVARIHDHPAVRIGGRADDVGVLLDRTDGEGADIRDGHLDGALPPVRRALIREPSFPQRFAWPCFACGA